MHRLGLLALAGCRIEVGAPDAPVAQGVAEVWVYTSMYQSVLDALSPALAADVPDVRVSWFQAGSEKVAQRWEAEHAAGRSPACLVATSDPGWYLDLAQRDALLPYVSPLALALDRRWVRPSFAPFRLSFMVLASSAEEAPASFEELAAPRWRDQVSSGDPLSSGTTFTTVAAWEQRFGLDWVRSLEGNGWIAAGGNSAVMTRLESGERRIGVVLHENLLAKPGVARVVIPSEGAVAIPGMLAIPRDCRAPEAARRVYDWLLGEVAQRAIVAGNMYSPFPGHAPPVGAPPLEELPQFEAGPDPFGYAQAHAPRLKAALQEMAR